MAGGYRCTLGHVWNPPNGSVATACPACGSTTFVVVEVEEVFALANGADPPDPDANGHPYLALEFVDGGSLAQRLTGEPWVSTRAAELIEILARTMQFAHDAGIVHRDLKPGNVLLASGGRKPPDASEESGGLRPPLA